ncbi:MAG TPA: hypothetical protein V6C72_01110, partial [Chroococcales cyanobacterium]
AAAIALVDSANTGVPLSVKVQAVEELAKIQAHSHTLGYQNDAMQALDEIKKIPGGVNLLKMALNDEFKNHDDEAARQLSVRINQAFNATAVGQAS